MKKICIFLLVMIFALSIAACGRRNDMGTNNDNMTILPTEMPTLDTNIPDPDINTEMPTYTDGTIVTDPFMDGTNPSDTNRK